jgi:hypothetical protein
MKIDLGLKLPMVLILVLFELLFNIQKLLVMGKLIFEINRHSSLFVFISPQLFQTFCVHRSPVTKVYLNKKKANLLILSLYLDYAL